MVMDQNLLLLLQISKKCATSHTSSVTSMVLADFQPVDFRTASVAGSSESTKPCALVTCCITSYPSLLAISLFKNESSLDRSDTAADEILGALSPLLMSEKRVGSNKIQR